jgi:adenylate cyclase
MAFKLISESNGQEYTLPDGATLVVGRGAGCDLMVLNPNISRRHAQVSVSGDSVAVRDLGSSNGTFVNGDRSSDGTAREGDVITFGTAAFRVARSRSELPGSASASKTNGSSAASTAKPIKGTQIRPIEHTDVGTIVTRLAAVAEGTMGGGVVDDGSHTAPRSLRRQLDALLAVAAELLRARDVAGIMTRVADHAVSLLQADRMAILLLDRMGALNQAVSRTAEGGEVEKMVPQSIARRALTEKVAILTDNATEDSRFTGDSVRMQLVRSAMCVPLFGESRDLGVLYVDSISASRAFSSDDLELTVAFAGIIAAAVEREQLAERLKREAVVRSGFERYFAPSLAARIASAPEEVRLGGSRSTVAVLFSDIRGFSSWSETMPAEETAQILSEYFGEMVECVFATGGTLDKFIGDALMAQWGAPISTGSDAANALRTAQLMHERLARLNAAWESKKRPVLEVGIGIGFGEVFVGNIGSTRRLEYTVIGDVVNVANRLASLAAPGEVLMSEDAFEAMRASAPGPLPRAEELEQLQVRGRTRNMRVYRVHLTRNG